MCFAPPCEVGLECGEEAVNVCFRNARASGRVRRAPDQIRDLADDLSGFLILGGGFRDDAISIEWALGKDAVLVQDVVQGDRAVVALVEIGQDPARRLENAPAFRMGIVNLPEPNVITSFGQCRGVAQNLERPFDGGSELPATNESFVISVDQFQRALIEIETLGRAAKGNLEALVQAAYEGHVRRLFEDELVDAAGAKKSGSSSSRYWIIVHFRLGICRT